jgi:hypothetical protein
MVSLNKLLMRSGAKELFGGERDGEDGWPYRQTCSLSDLISAASGRA